MPFVNQEDENSSLLSHFSKPKETANVCVDAVINEIPNDNGVL